ncbi:MAG TPA: glycosyltransferase [Acidobacteriota bacterium]|nr:glycosyltransferase [Acidobacteriota bacterium]
MNNPVEMKVEKLNRDGGSSAVPGVRTTHVVLPAYNEAANVGSVLKSLEKAGRESGMRMHAIVVDDGSSDSTGQVVRDQSGYLEITLIEHQMNLGLGAALRSGLLNAIDHAQDNDVIVTMDADDTHAPSAIAGMVALIDQGFDVLIASRYRKGAQVIGVPLLRRFLSYAGSVLFRLVFPIRGVRDFTCGYRAYRASVLREATSRYRRELVNQEGFQCMVDILLKLSRMHLRFGEVPLVLRYDRKSGKSKMRVLRTIYRTLVLLFKRRLGL